MNELNEHAHDFDLDAGVLCLDFANTVNWHASDHPEEKLHTYTDLLAWAETAEILTTERAQQLNQLAEQQPQEARSVYQQAIELRESIYRIFADFSTTGECDPADLAILNEALNIALPHLQVAPAREGFQWDWAESRDDFSQPLWPLARSAGDLLTSDQLDRVSQCADDRGCGYLFLDISRNRSRRWCSMESCGNRAKAQRHYQRQKEE